MFSFICMYFSMIKFLLSQYLLPPKENDKTTKLFRLPQAPVNFKMSERKSSLSQH